MINIRPLPPFRLAKTYGPQWVGKPMHLLRLKTIFANLKRTPK